MKYSMQRAILSGFSVILAAFSLSPEIQAAESLSKDYSSLHQQRLAEFDSRNKNFDIKEGFNVHQQRLSEFDRRNKVGDSLSKTPLIAQRHLLLNRNKRK